MSKARDRHFIGAAFLLSAVLMIASCPARAGELGHYAPGVLNIRDFFVPEPGWYALLYEVLMKSKLSVRSVREETECGKDKKEEDSR